MPFTYSITAGIGAGFIAYVAHQGSCAARPRRSTRSCGSSPALFVLYFAIDPIKDVFGV